MSVKHIHYRMMRIIIIFLIFSYSVSKPITNGYDAVESNQFPFSVLLIAKNGATCMGNILTEKWILTAAHCTKTHNNLIIKYGNIDKNKMLTGTSDLILMHPNFEKLFNKNADLSLVRIKNSFNFSNNIQPIYLPSKNFIKNDLNGISTGFGRIISPANIVSKNLKWINLRILNNTNCLTWFEKYQPFSDTFCGYGEQVGQGICKGDSGTGFAIESKLYNNFNPQTSLQTNKIKANISLYNLKRINNWILIGIASLVVNNTYADYCENYPSLYVNVFNYIDWILHSISINENK